MRSEEEGAPAPSNEETTEQAMVEGASVELENVSPCLRRVTVGVAAEETERETSSVLDDLRARAKVPGFRPGKAPLAMVQARYRDELGEEVRDRIISRVLSEVMRNQEWHPVTDPRVKEVRFEGEGPLSFTAEIEVEPEIPPLGWRGLKGRRPRIDVAEKEIEAEVNRLRDTRAEFLPVERGAEPGDLLIVDYERCDTDDPREKGKKVSNLPVELGAQGLLPDFDRGLRGAVKGSSRQVDIRYPDDFREKDLAGKEIKLAVTVKELKEKRLPPLDDEFARSLGDYDTMAALREKLAEGVRRAKEREAERQLDSSLVDALINATPLEVPPSLVEGVLAGIRRDLGGAPGGEEPASPDSRMEKLYRSMAEREVKRMFLMREMARREDVRVPPEEVESRLGELAERIARDEKAPAGDVRKRLRKEGMDRRIADRLTEEKVIQLLRDNAEVIEEGAPI